MAFTVRREGSSLSNSIQTNIESSSATNTKSQDVSITVNQTPKNQHTEDVEKQSKDAQDFASSKKSDLQLQTLFSTNAAQHSPGRTDRSGKERNKPFKYGVRTQF